MKTERTKEQHLRDCWEHGRAAALRSVEHFVKLMHEEPCELYAFELLEYAGTVRYLTRKIEGKA